MDDVRLEQELVSVFDRAAPDFDQSGVQFFGPAAARLVEHAGIRPGHHVLDVGCGRGAVPFAAAEAAGPEGRVTGIDLAPEMVRETALDVRRRGLANVAIEVMDGEQPSFPPATFDAVLGSFSVVLLPHAVDALPRYRALLRAGGVLRSPRSSGRGTSGCAGAGRRACGSCGRRRRRRTGRAWRHGSPRRSRAGEGRTGRSRCPCRCGSSWHGDARRPLDAMMALRAVGQSEEGV